MTNLTVLHANPTWLHQTQTWLYSQLAEVQKQGVNTHIVCEYISNLDQFNLPNIHCLENETWIKQRADRWLRRLGVRNYLNYQIEVGKQCNANIFHSHFGDNAWKNLGAVSHLGIKHIVTFYGYDVNHLPNLPIWRKRFIELFEEADLFLCEGSHMAKCLVELGCPKNKVKVKHLGVDLDRFKFKPRKWTPHEPLRVLIAASFREKKGIPFAIEALGWLQKEIKIELTIIGDAGSDVAGQQEKKTILDIIDRVGLKPNTRLLGYQSHSVMLKEAYLHHIFLQPSVTASNGDTEGGAPVSIIEMLATGMLVVSTMHCDIPEVMGSGLHELLAPERNVDELVEIIRKLISKPDDWVLLACKGREHIAAEYDLNLQSKKQKNHYCELIKSK